MLNYHEEFKKTFKGWTCLNFYERKFYISDGTKSGTPANQYQHEFFIKNFIEKGKKTCSFMEFRDLAFKIVYQTSDYVLFTEYYDFNHKKPDSIRYGKIEIRQNTFFNLFRLLENKSDSLESGLYSLIREFHELRDLQNDNKNNDQNNDQKMTKEELELIDLGKAVKTILNSFKI